MELLAEQSLGGASKKDEILAEVKKITDQGMNGEIPIPESLARRFALIKARRDHIQSVAQTLTTLVSRSFLENRTFFAKNSRHIHVVSSGFTELIYPVSDILGIMREHVHANSLLFSEDGSVLGVDPGNLLAQNLGKVRLVESLALPRPVVIVGDGYTDYEIRKHGAADIFIAYIEHANRERVAREADFLAKSFDDVLTSIRVS